MRCLQVKVFDETYRLLTEYNHSMSYPGLATKVGLGLGDSCDCLCDLMFYIQPMMSAKSSCFIGFLIIIYLYFNVFWCPTTKVHLDATSTDPYALNRG